MEAVGGIRVVIAVVRDCPPRFVSIHAADLLLDRDNLRVIVFVFDGVIIRITIRGRCVSGVAVINALHRNHFVGEVIVGSRVLTLRNHLLVSVAQSGHIFGNGFFGFDRRLPQPIPVAADLRQIVQRLIHDFPGKHSRIGRVRSRRHRLVSVRAHPLFEGIGVKTFIRLRDSRMGRHTVFHHGRRSDDIATIILPGDGIGNIFLFGYQPHPLGQGTIRIGPEPLHVCRINIISVDSICVATGKPVQVARLFHIHFCRRGSQIDSRLRYGQVTGIALNGVPVILSGNFAEGPVRHIRVGLKRRLTVLFHNRRGDAHQRAGLFELCNHRDILFRIHDRPDTFNIRPNLAGQPGIELQTGSGAVGSKTSFRSFMMIHQSQRRRLVQVRFGPDIIFSLAIALHQNGLRISGQGHTVACDIQITTVWRNNVVPVTLYRYKLPCIRFP